MTARNLLAIKKLPAFKAWLDANSIENRATNAAYQVLQVRGVGDGRWHPIYKKLNAKEHLSVPRPLVFLAEQFLRREKIERSVGSDVMKTIKTRELSGVALDWAVWVIAGGAAAYPKTASGPAFLKLWRSNTTKYVHPSTDWAQGGPIIERENISTVREGDAADWIASVYDHKASNWHLYTPGPTPLTAAMRCFCASRLGDEVEVPEELSSPS